MLKPLIVLLLTGVVGVAVPGAAVASPAGTISTVAGNPLPSGPATTIGQVPQGVAVGPGGVVYIAEGTVRGVSATGFETTVAGDGTSSGFSGDGGPAVSAEVSADAVAVDGVGDLLIADYGNDRVRLVAGDSCAGGCPYGLASMVKGDIYTIAGDGTAGYSGDGAPATRAELNEPDALTVDSDGDVLIGDLGNGRVRMVAERSCASDCSYGLTSMRNGDIYTVAGAGILEPSADGVPATSASLSVVADVAVDGGGDLLIVEDDPSSLVLLVAGSSCSAGCPYGLRSMVKGDIYTVAGDGTAGYSGDGGAAASAELDYPDGVAVDHAGNLLITDTGNQLVRLVAGSSCASGCPYGLASMTKGDIYTIAGTFSEVYGGGFAGDGGPAVGSELSFPRSIAVDGAGDVLIADQNNYRVRLVAGRSCASGCPYGLVSMTKGDIYTIAGNGSDEYSGDAVPATDAELDQPGGVSVDGAGDLLLADTDNDVVRLVAGRACAAGCPFGLASMTRGDIYTVAGTPSFPWLSGYAGDGGPARRAELSLPEDAAVDGGGDLLIADEGNERVRLVAAASCSAACPYGLASMIEGDIYTIAGDGTQADSGDGGPASSAALFDPVGVEVDSAGDVLVADEDFDLGDRVRLVAASSCTSGCPFGLASMTKGDIYTIAGGGTGGLGDGGSATSAELTWGDGRPGGMAIDRDGDLLIADYYQQRVRLVAGHSCASGCPYGLASMSKGDIYTIVGDGTQGYSGDSGPAGSAELSEPDGLTVDSDGDLLIADSATSRVRLVAGYSCASGCPYGLASMTKGDIYTIAGNGIAGYLGNEEPAISAELDRPEGLAVNGAGDLFISDTDNNRIREVTAHTTEPFSVSLAGSGKGSVTGDGITCPGACSTSLAPGAVVSLTATPAIGSMFAGWSGGGCSGTAGCQVTVTAATQVTATFVSNYASLVQSTPGLVAYWPLGDRSGTVATDESGSDGGTYAGGFTLSVTGPIFGSSTTAVGLDGVSADVRLPALGSLANWTVEGWSDLNAGASANPYGDNCLYCGRDGVRLIILPSGFYADDVTTGTKLGVLRGVGASNVGGWVYWALVRSGQTLTLYRDGLQVGSDSLGGEGASALDGAIGTYGGRYFLHGDVGQVAVYGAALSPAEVLEHYQVGSTGSSG
jgi:hypothetical protein